MRIALITELIRSCPEIFRKTCVVGVYDGTHFTKALLECKDQIDILHMYEDFRDMDKDEIPYFKKLYESWKAEVFYQTGEIGGDYTLQKLEFLKEMKFNKDSDTIITGPGFGTNIDITAVLIEWMDKKELIPVWKYNDYIFFAQNQNRYNRAYNYIIENLKMPYHIRSTKHGDIIDLNNWYSQVKEFKL